jgi:hypothetical protein
MGRLRNNLIVVDSEDCDPACRPDHRAFRGSFWERQRADADRAERAKFEANLVEWNRIDGLR